MFNFTNVNPDDFSPLPAGMYKAFVDNAEWCETKSGTGEYLKITFKILDTEYEGRLVWHMMNLINKNDVAVQIALKDFVKLITALGHDKDKLANVEKHQVLELIDQKEVFIKLSIKEDDYGKKNVVKGYEPVEAPKGVVDATEADLPF